MDSSHKIFKLCAHKIFKLCVLSPTLLLRHSSGGWGHGCCALTSDRCIDYGLTIQLCRTLAVEGMLSSKTMHFSIQPSDGSSMPPSYTLSLRVECLPGDSGKAVWLAKRTYTPPRFCLKPHANSFIYYLTLDRVLNLTMPQVTLLAWLL